MQTNKIIRANELRTGNYADRLYWNPQPGHEVNEKENCKVVSIQHLTVNIELKNSKTIIAKYSLANLFPILLTPEILVKCGFEKGRETCYLRIESDYGCEINMFEGKTFLQDVDGGNIGVEIKYLHQLQNLYFALTGEELEVAI